MVEHAPQEEPQNPERRRFLKGAFGAALLTTDFMAAAPALYYGYQYRREMLDLLFDAQHASDRYVRKTQEFLEGQYGIRVRFGPDYQDDSYEAAGLSVAEAQRALGLLLISLYKYPVDFFRKNQLPQIRIANKVELKREPGLSSGESAREQVGGFADARYLMIGYTDDPNVFEVTVHHELYHELDRRDKQKGEDETWENIQRPFGEYRGEQWDEASPTSYPLDVFAYSYGSRNVVEDQATIAASLMTAAYHAPLMDRIAQMKDPAEQALIEEKIRRIKEEYYRWSDGAMDEAFWLRVEERSREAQRRTYRNPLSVTVEGSPDPVRVVGPGRYDDYYLNSEHYDEEVRDWYAP